MANDYISNRNRELELAELLKLHNLAASGDKRAIKRTLEAWLKHQ